MFFFPKKTVKKQLRIDFHKTPRGEGGHGFMKHIHKKIFFTWPILPDGPNKWNWTMCVCMYVRHRFEDDHYFCPQGCIFRLTCSHRELTKDHVLTSTYVNIFRTVTRNAVNKSV